MSQHSSGARPEAPRPPIAEARTMMPCVPFDASWVGSTKLDLHAVYRRPVRDEAGEIIRWDLTTGLPMRRHLDWIAKGYEYVTLSDAESLAQVAGLLRQRGLDPREFIMDPRTNSPWNASRYLRDLEAKPASAKAAR